jgi:hypothetical protein
MIEYGIRGSSTNFSESLRFGFSIWARNQPKDYLSVYPKALQEIGSELGSKNVSLCALVDDVLPRITLSRTLNEQKEVSDSFLSKLPSLGFHEVYLVSNFVEESNVVDCLSYASRVTVAEFWKLLPKSKKEIQENVSLSEITSFLWHIYVLDMALKKYQLTGFIAGIRSEYFYLSARKLLPPHDTYFVNTA